MLRFSLDCRSSLSNNKQQSASSQQSSQQWTSVLSRQEEGTEQAGVSREGQARQVGKRSRSEGNATKICQSDM